MNLRILYPSNPLNTKQTDDPFQLEYEAVQALGIQTSLFLDKDSDYLAQLQQLGWDAYFIKDFVKSNTDTQGSIAKSPQEAIEIIAKIKLFRGDIEGGISIRRVEPYLPNSET